ncbi:hypothetical protein LCGC14_1599600 [marine sediment metagenome]|uniref:Uncharacterized protein n=1 Tax=marine sediment metagenome TaxID=412755 RepID=A0A0F9IXZ7_9ZZZZ
MLPRSVLGVGEGRSFGPARFPASVSAKGATISGFVPTTGLPRYSPELDLIEWLWG